MDLLVRQTVLRKMVAETMLTLQGALLLQEVPTPSWIILIVLAEAFKSCNGQATISKCGSSPEINQFQLVFKPRLPCLMFASSEDLTRSLMDVVLISILLNTRSCSQILSVATGVRMHVYLLNYTANYYYSRCYGRVPIRQLTMPSGLYHYGR